MLTMVALTRRRARYTSIRHILLGQAARSAAPPLLGANLCRHWFAAVFKALTGS